MNGKFSILFFLSFFSCQLLIAQLYESAAGIRLGAPSSLSYKKVFNENKAVEGIFGTRGKDGYRYVTVAAAYQIIEPIDMGGIEELYYYYGGGASIYFWNFEQEGNNQNVTPGLQAYVGVEYTFGDRPINLTLDWIPTLFISGHLAGLRGGYLNLGVRYVLFRSGAESNLNTNYAQ